MAYHYRLGRLISPRAYMRFLGWPTNLLPDDYTSHEYALLSGNAFSAPITGMIGVVLFFNPWSPLWQS